MRRTKYLLILLLLALPILGWVAIAHAQSFRSGNNITVPAGKTINNTLFAAGRTIDIAGTVNGDVFCAGQNVTVSGRVHGDVICTGQNVTVSGTVSGDVRLAGQDVTLGAKVDGNATIGAQTYVQQSSGVVSGDLSIAGQDATLNGAVGRDVASNVSTLAVANTVGRNIQANVGKLQLTSGAKVGGNITYASSQTLDRSSGAQVAGSITHHAPPAHAHHPHPFAGWLFALYLYVAFVITSLVLVLLFPRVFEHTARTARGRLGKTILVGFIASIVMPIILTALAITIVGIPLALLAGLAWLLAVLLAGPFAAYLFGKWLLADRHNAITVMLVGAVILFLLYLLPFIGWLFWLVGLWFGLGAMLLQVRRFGRPHYDMSMLPAADADTETKQPKIM